MKLSLNTDLYLEPTPAGAFYAVSAKNDEPARRLLQSILGKRTSPITDFVRVTMWSGLQQKEAVELVHRLQELGWLNGMESARSAPDGPLEALLPDMLAQVSIEGKALLADEHGFYLSTSGIAHETAEALSALSADLGSLYDRHQRLLVNNLGQREHAWTLADAAGNSHLGFWPLHIGAHRFVLVIEGRPTLNQPAFRDLIWILAIRYSAKFNLNGEADNA